MWNVYSKAAMFGIVFILMSNAWSALKLGARFTNILNKEADLWVESAKPYPELVGVLWVIYKEFVHWVDFYWWLWWV